MANKLIIVESPAKVKTIKKFLGSGYEVAASNGHIRDLPKSQLGVDVEQDFQPKYITIRGKGDLVASLRKLAKKADKIYLATDPDREGEAISWHLTKALKLEGKDVSRITFNEITKDAVKESLKHPTTINEDLVNSQQVRRILDRVVGYKISPVLWSKVKSGLSAGRVQSAALKMVCDKEEEIAKFVPQEYWNFDVSLEIPGEKKNLTAQFYGVNGKKKVIGSKEEALEIEKTVNKGDFVVSDVKESTRTKNPPLPFTTSTLQQDAANQLNFATSKTMRLAQQLYEGVDIKGKGTIGLITYLRTDSTRIAEEADATVRDYIGKNYGAEYVTKGLGSKGKGKKIQDAHEAIRPSDVTLSPAMLKDDLSRDLFRLYQLIWKRFVASRMRPAIYENINVKLTCDKYMFTATGSKLSFPGYLNVYSSDSEKTESNTLLKKLSVGEKLKLAELEKSQHFTQPPAHYTEASLVKAMEEAGIGRPSTYAPTIGTILARHYVGKEGKNLFVTELGEVVNQILISSFPKIVDTDFTANMENELDQVEEGTMDWHQIMRDFYPDFEKSVEKAEKELEHVKIEDEKTDVICELCGRNMVVKYGKHGKFLACPGFPECRNTKPYLEKIGVKCPKCGKDIVVRRTKKGRRFYGCENNPECDFMTWVKPTPETVADMVKPAAEVVETPVTKAKTVATKTKVATPKKTTEKKTVASKKTSAAKTKTTTTKKAAAAKTKTGTKKVATDSAKSK